MQRPLPDVLEAAARGAVHEAALPPAARRAAGAFYTPGWLVEHLLDGALEPLLEEACGADDPAAALLDLRVCDPACGAGAFLVAARARIAARLAAVGGDGTAVAARCLAGADRDPAAVDLCRRALALARHARGRASIVQGDALLGATPALLAAGLPDGALRPVLDDDLARAAALRRRNRLERRTLPAAPSSAAAADAYVAAFLVPKGAGQPALTHAALAGPLDDGQREAVAAIVDRIRPVHWQLAFPGAFERERPGFDLVIGNPPFLNALERATAADRRAAALLAARFGDAARGYADAAAAFLALALEFVRPGGTVALVLPASLLAARDAAPVRRRALQVAALAGFWGDDGRAFGAGVQTCALILRRGAPPGPVARSGGSPPQPLPPAAAPEPTATWGRLLRGPDGEVPEPGPLATAGRLGEHATATADFRDQYYGLVPFVADGADGPPLITSGLIDPLHCLWGRRPARFARREHARPRVDLGALLADGALASWARARLVPKLLLATQTRVLEAVADPAGELLPCTPVITVVPAPGRLWHVAAALSAPPLATFARAEYAGAALAQDAVKLSASQVVALPAPAGAAAWDEGARAAQAAHEAADAAGWSEALGALGAAMCRAYGLEADGPLADWWRSSLPPWR